MNATMRALLSVLMLIGFFVLGVAELGAVTALAILLLVKGSAVIAVKVTVPLFIALVGGVGAALWQAIRVKNEPMQGVLVTPDQAPRLWAEVRGLASAVGTRAPDEIRIVPDVNAAVSEHSSLLGLIPGRRYLYLGLPLLQALTADQLRAVLAHELGHYSGSHTRVGAVAYRGRIAVQGSVARIGKWNVAGWPIRGYARLYLLVDNAVSRRQELEADAAAVRLAGRAAAVSALTEVSVVSMAYDFYLDRYVGPGAELGFMPDNVFAGFGPMLAARQDEIAALRGKAPSLETGSLWDTHPPLNARIAAINALPEGAVSAAGHPAMELMPDLGMVSSRLQSLVVQTKDREVLPWDRFVVATATKQMQMQADGLFRELGRKLGNPQLGLAGVLDAMAAGRAGELGEGMFPDATRKEAAVKFAMPLELLMALAAVRSERAVWRSSWTSGPELVDLAGEPFDLSPVALLAVNPATLPDALVRLKEMGIEVEAARVADVKATAVGAEVIAGLANVKFGGVESDVFALNNGLVVIRTSEDKDDGTNRLRRIASAMTAQQLAERYRFLPYEEFRKVTVTKPVPLRASIELHDGQTIEVREGWMSEELHKKSRDLFREVFEGFSGE